MWVHQRFSCILENFRKLDVKIDIIESELNREKAKKYTDTTKKIKFSEKKKKNYFFNPIENNWL